MDDTEVVDFLCWKFASDAERFYPVIETAKSCMDGLPDDRYEEGSLEEAEALGWEKGEHSARVTEARQVFKHVERLTDDDPTERVERYVERVREEDDLTEVEFPLPSFEWWEK